jgi:hypothetical protein
VEQTDDKTPAEVYLETLFLPVLQPFVWLLEHESLLVLLGYRVNYDHGAGVAPSLRQRFISAPI